MLLVSAPASGLSPAASVECRAHGSHDRCRPNGSEPVLRNAYEQGFRRRRVVCPPEAHHGRVQDLCERRATPARGSLKRSIGFVRVRAGLRRRQFVAVSLHGGKRRLAGSFRFSQLAAGRPGGLLIPRSQVRILHGPWKVPAKRRIHPSETRLHRPLGRPPIVDPAQYARESPNRHERF